MEENVVKFYTVELAHGTIMSAGDTAAEAIKELYQIDDDPLVLDHQLFSEKFALEKVSGDHRVVARLLEGDRLDDEEEQMITIEDEPYPEREVSEIRRDLGMSPEPTRDLHYVHGLDLDRVLLVRSGVVLSEWEVDRDLFERFLLDGNDPDLWDVQDPGGLRGYHGGIIRLSDYCGKVIGKNGKFFEKEKERKEFFGVEVE